MSTQPGEHKCSASTSVLPKAMSTAACSDWLTICCCRAAAAGYPAAHDCLKLYRCKGHSIFVARSLAAWTFLTLSLPRRFQWWTVVFELIVAGGLTLCLLRESQELHLPTCCLLWSRCCR